MRDLIMDLVKSYPHDASFPRSILRPVERSFSKTARTSSGTCHSHISRLKAPSVVLALICHSLSGQYYTKIKPPAPLPEKGKAVRACLIECGFCHCACHDFIISICVYYTNCSPRVKRLLFSVSRNCMRYELQFDIFFGHL